MKRPPKIMIIAGEASADVYGGLLAVEIRRLSPGAELFGFGGGGMARAGVRIHYPLVDLAVIGFLDVFRHFRTFFGLLRMSRELLETQRPDAVVLLDYPGFNLRVAAQAKKLGIPVVYYISPQVWAWRPGRIHRIAELVTKMLVVLPFEVALYKKVGCPVEFVGHPLLDVLRGVKKAKKPNNRRALVALLPGSRLAEVNRLLPTMLQVAERLAAYEPADFFLPLAPTISRDVVDRYLRGAKVFVKVVTRDAMAMRKTSDFALVASGTATLETGLMRVPMVILYRVARVNYWLAWLLVQVDRIGLVNFVAGKKIVPEFIQHDCRVDLVLPQALALLQQTGQRRQMKRDLARMSRTLGYSESGDPGNSPSRRAARAVLKVVKDVTG